VRSNGRQGLVLALPISLLNHSDRGNLLKEVGDEHNGIYRSRRSRLHLNRRLHQVGSRVQTRFAKSRMMTCTSLGALSRAQEFAIDGALHWVSRRQVCEVLAGLSSVRRASTAMSSVPTLALPLMMGTAASVIFGRVLPTNPRRGRLGRRLTFYVVLHG
jgi:hypothetical protein